MELLNILASNFTPRMKKKNQTKNKTHKFLNECCEFLLFSHSTHVGQSFPPLQSGALQVILGYRELQLCCGAVMKESLTVSHKDSVNSLL